MPAETHCCRDVSRPVVKRAVFETAADLLGISVDEVNEATLLPEDTVGIVDLVQYCEEEFAERTLLTDTWDDLDNCVTVGDIFELVCEKLGVITLTPSDELAEFELLIGHQFDDRSYLLTALCHRSWVAENEHETSNERLEFLGDAVLGLIVADLLYTGWPALPEGVLAKARSAVVSAEFLAEAAARLDLGRFLFLGKGERSSGGRDKPSILADAIEAVIGALYLDGGIDAAKKLVLTIVADKLAAAVTVEGSKDYKTRLQETAARQLEQVPVYDVVSFGPDHAKRFEATVSLSGAVMGKGTGGSKKQAEQAAARQAVGALLDNESSYMNDEMPNENTEVARAISDRPEPVNSGPITLHGEHDNA